MKLKCLTLLMLTMFSISSLSAQNQEPLNCATDLSSSGNGVFFSPMNNPIYSGSTDPAVLASYPPISFNIYFWIIRRSDGTSELNVTYESILETLKRVNEYYKPMGICFILKGYDYINADEIYEDVAFHNILGYANSNGHVIPNCFNVYSPRSLVSGNGITYLGSDKLAVPHPHFLGIWGTVKGNTLAHELAHDFNLLHPWGQANNTLITLEHVTRDSNDPNYNALTAADFIHDTPAMASFQAEDGTIYDIVDQNTCEYTGSNTDALGVPFSLTPIDVGNLMAYTLPSCQIGFTIGQGIRIREYIDGTPNSLSVQAMRNDNIALDLYIKDSPEDFGEEPNVLSQYLWNSHNIWVRNEPDSIQEHQNPEYDPNNPNYAYVRVTNRGCDTSTGNETVKLYWSKAGTSLNWDYHWTGNNFPDNGPSLGDEIGTLNIPVLEPGQEAVLQFEWYVPDPADYNAINDQPWHFCLLARIEAVGDQMAVTEVIALPDNVRNNNNIAWKNLTVIDLEPNSAGKPIGGVIGVGNLSDQLNSYDLLFEADTSETGKKVYEEAEVSINLDNTLWDAWDRGGKIGNNIRVVQANKIVVTGDKAMLKNLIFEEGEIGTLDLKFNFLTEEVTDKELYVYHVVQREAADSTVVGGETYEIRRQPRTLFYADAGNDVQVDKNEPVVLSAEPINEPAKYNWYDSAGNLLYEGISFTTSTQVMKQYKLEVVALSDGYKDYANVEVSLKPNSIQSVSPNPTSGLVQVNYNINQGSSAYISVTGFYSSSETNNYLVNINEDMVLIDVSDFPDGLYTVSLVTDGEISDNTTLIKE